LLLVAGCTRVPASRPTQVAPLTRFDWQPPCRVPVREHVVQDKDTEYRVSYVVEVAPGQGRLEVRLRDFALLELNGEDMSAPEQKAMGNAVVAQWALLPVLYVSADGQLAGVGPVELDRIAEELNLSEEQRTQLRPLDGGPYPQIADRGAERWRTWVSAWTDWTLAPGQKRERNAVLATYVAGDVPVVERAEAKRGAGEQLELELTYTLDKAGVAKLHARLIDMAVKSFSELGLSEPDTYQAGREQITYSAQLDPRTLRPAHTRYESLLHTEFAETGAGDNHELREADWDWPHAEGCGR